MSSNRERISDSNKGFQLLKKAGWVEGTGLGVNKQGRTTPLNAWRNQGRSGIGCKKPKTQTPNPKLNPNSTVKRKSKAVSKTTEDEGRKHRRILHKLSEVELTSELDSNPLLRPNALSVTNPLLP